MPHIPNVVGAINGAANVEATEVRYWDDSSNAQQCRIGMAHYTKANRSGLGGAHRTQMRLRPSAQQLPAIARQWGARGEAVA